jgi:hypothetical protein
VLSPASVGAGCRAWTVDAASGKVYGEGVRMVSQPWKTEGQSERVWVMVDLPLPVPSLGLPVPSLGTAFTSTLLPDLWDPATFGCLLALVRQAWGAGVYLVPDGGWIVKGARLKNGATVNLGIVAKNEAEALVAALEVAP